MVRRQAQSRQRIFNDMEKYNSATIMGWKVLRYPPNLMLTKAIADLKEIGL